jgi:phosphate:Na+ symporter
MISALLGGVGLFLLGMTLLTEGLKATAGGALRDVLGRFTGGVGRAFLSGAALTALVQSSSATIVMTIGFVSAGLLGFVQAIGVIFGAAVGTTSTGWIVSLLGLRYSVSALALPIVGIGALIRLLASGRGAPIGLAIAGFGLIFLGIDTLQAGMETLAERFDLGALRPTGFAGRLLLLLIGIAMTVVMQSSSAAVATTLAAVHTGTIEIPQAAILVIGQNVGTTVTAALASIGASVPARRTAMAHILLNSFSGVVALAMLPLYLLLLARVFQAGLGPAEGIALFHTSFNLVGVLLLMPMTRGYARVIARLVPDRTPRVTRFLDDSLRAVPPVAVEAARRTTIGVAGMVLAAARGALGDERDRAAVGERLEVAEQALVGTRGFLAGVRSSPADPREYARHLAVLHALDHLERMIEALQEPPSIYWREAESGLRRTAGEVSASLLEPLRWLEDGAQAADVPDVHALSVQVAERRRDHRPRVMERTAAGEIDPDTALRTLDAMRWIDRVVYHVWRTVHHLAGGAGEELAPVVERYSDPPAEAEGKRGAAADP